jgi:hypothetical protein
VRPSAPSRLALLAIAALAVIGLAAGCGGDEEAGGDASEGSDSAAQLSKAQFVERANAVCARSRNRFQQGAANYVPPETKRTDGVVPSADTFAGAFEEVGLPAIEQQAIELRELVGMRDDEAFTSYLAELEAALRDVEGEDEVTGPEFLARFKTSTRMARTYGLATCTLG